MTSQNFDFEARLQAVKEDEERARAERKESKKRKREEAKNVNSNSNAVNNAKSSDGARGADAAEEMKKVAASHAQTQSGGQKGAFGHALAEERKRQEEEDTMAAMMGFGGFGGAAKQKK